MQQRPPTDWTTIILALCATTIILAMIGVYGFGPPEVRDEIQPILTPILTVIGLTVAGIVSQRNAQRAQETRDATRISAEKARIAAEETKSIAQSTHAIINSQADKLAALNADTAQAALVAADQRVALAAEEGYQRGKAENASPPEVTG